jgi:Holliday junction resolvasome RuvABC endonuclease subunit
VSDGRRTQVVSSAYKGEDRLNDLVDQLIPFIESADLVVMEAPAWSRQGQAHHEDLTGLRVMLRCLMTRRLTPFTLVTPSNLKRAVTGNGSAVKQTMVDHLDHMYGLGLSEFKVSHGRYDRADALGLSAMGYQGLHQPLQLLPDSRGLLQSAVDVVQWPTLAVRT